MSGVPRNVVLLTIDSLRAERFLRPRARDALAAFDRLDDGPDGVRFSRAFATGPGTTPSFPGILTGTYPLSMGGFEPMQPRRPFLAETVSAAGLSTGGFTSNPFLSASFNYDRGFDEFVDYQNPLMGIATRLFPRGVEVRTPLLRAIDDRVHLTDALKKGYELVAGKARPYVAADVVTDDAITWIRGVDGPFFCWAHYMDVHHPCYPPEKHRTAAGVRPGVTAGDVADLYATFVRSPADLSAADLETLDRLYDAAIAFVDDQINRLLDALEADGIADETLVAITSDHGELFGEHGEYAKPERLYDELLHVPLVASGVPASIRAARDDLVSLVDLPALVHASLGLPGRDDDGRIPGIDEPREHVLAEHTRNGDAIVGVRGDEYRFEIDRIRDTTRIYRLYPDDADEREVSVDPDAVPAADLSALRRAAFDRLDAIDDEPAGVELDRDVTERLEDLGYL